MNKLSRLDAALPDVWRLLEKCCLCGHSCGVDRTKGAVGFCRARAVDLDHARCSSWTLHFGEEPPLVGQGGSGTVFFTHCNLRCVFCQNYQISQEGLGDDVNVGDLAGIFLQLQRDGAENLNWVTPTHYIYPILAALRQAIQEGFRLPIVYNTNGYDSVQLLRLLEGIVDIYLPDLKYMNEANAVKYSSAPGYPEVAKAAIKEMYRQVGRVRMYRGVARKGLIIRHLVLPNNIADSYDFLLWLRDEGMEDVTLSIMRQYSPRHRAAEFPELNAHISAKEYREVVKSALDLGFTHLLTQGIESRDIYFPDFEQDKPFEHR
jgi:putative pyruvate formate lyase activating enzyme